MVSLRKEKTPTTISPTMIIVVKTGCRMAMPTRPPADFRDAGMAWGSVVAAVLSFSWFGMGEDWYWISRLGFFVSARLSGHEHKYDDVRCTQFGRWQGARREHIPKWICDRRSTQPQAEWGATRRAAVLFRPDFVARSLQIHFGICASLAPRLAEKSLAANVIVFMFLTT